MKQRKRIRWPVRWTVTEENLIKEVSKQADACPTQFIRTVTINKAKAQQERANCESEGQPQTNEQRLKRNIFDYMAREGWVKTAVGLQKTAEILKSARSGATKYTDTIWPELMIWGFCLENLLKGLYSKKQAAGLLKDKQAKALDKDGELLLGRSKHNLEIWCKRAEVSNFSSPDQARILRDLTQIIIHDGRYPVPIKWNESKPVYWGGETYDNILLKMIDFLKQEIEKINP